MHTYSRFFKKALFITALCSLFIPAVSHAYTLDDAKRQIESLKTELVGLRKQMGALSFTGVSATPISATTTDIATDTTTEVDTLIPTTGGDLTNDINPQPRPVPVPLPEGGCTITSLTASPATIASGTFSIIKWSTNGCTSASINGVTKRTNGFMITGVLTATTKYTLTASTTVGCVTLCMNKRASVTVTVLASEPSITVISPNGGEVYYEGQQINVTWSSLGIPQSNTNVTISLQAYSNGTNFASMRLATQTLNDGQELVTLPASVAGVGGAVVGKNFKISVGITDDNTNSIGIDFSDELFTITNSPNTYCTTGTDFVVSLAPSTPPAQMVGVGKKDVTFATYDVTACRDGVTLTRIQSDIMPINQVESVENIRMTYNDNLISTALASQNHAVFYMNVPFGANETKTFSVVGDVTNDAFIGSQIYFQWKAMAWSPYTNGAIKYVNATSNIFTVGTPIFPEGCSSTSGFSIITGQPCNTSGLPDGCTSTVGYSITTGKPCGVPITITPIPLPPTTGTTCAINSFVVPSGTTKASRLPITVSWSSNCDLVHLIADSGSYYEKYIGGASGTYTFVAPPEIKISSFSTTDNSVDITLYASNTTDVVTATKSVPITDMPLVSYEQCAFTSLEASDAFVTSATPQTTLRWEVPNDCRVYVMAMTTSPNGLIPTYIFNNSGTYHYNAIDSVDVTPTASTSYYINALNGFVSPTINNAALTVKTIDIKKK